MTKQEQVSTIIDNEINPGEEIVWQGQADANMFLKKWMEGASNYNYVFYGDDSD